ncbi:MAG TPA: hypothetical protein VFQ25_06315 [Ktedonobacterales bacterium]|nr:hypothetical protein [Ktedonobacterales bacterium]
MRKRFALAGLTMLLSSVLLVTLLFGNGWLPGVSAAAPRPNARAAAQRGVTVRDLQALFFVWASGTPAIQRVAARDCARLKLSARQCARISAATRAAWLDMAALDPAAVGRPNARPNPTGQAKALAKLTASLRSATNDRVAPLLTQTRATLTQISQPSWMNINVLYGLAIPSGAVLVWGTSFTQNSLPNGLDPKTSPYVALPDAYLKYANWGQISNIPTIYQSYYAPSGTATDWTVNIRNGAGTRGIDNVLITDVGPWNEDDNWWDPNGTSTTLPSSCPVASPPAFADATSNALVDGVCPTGNASGNLRRIYYYLLYQHGGLPFFQRGSYAPSGSFQDGGAWPTTLRRYCSEAAAANSTDGVTCYAGTSAYNTTNGGWLRDGTYDSGITNQSSIDMGPATVKALGWTYPSSGLVLVTVSALP